MTTGDVITKTQALRLNASIGLVGCHRGDIHGPLLDLSRTGGPRTYQCLTCSPASRAPGGHRVVVAPDRRRPARRRSFSWGGAVAVLAVALFGWWIWQQPHDGQPAHRPPAHVVQP